MRENKKIIIIKKEERNIIMKKESKIRNVIQKIEKCILLVGLFISMNITKLTVKANALSEDEALDVLQDTAIVKGAISLFKAIFTVIVVAGDVVGAVFIAISIFQYMTGEDELKPKHKKRGFVTLGAMILITLLRISLPAIFKIFGVDITI